MTDTAPPSTPEPVSLARPAKAQRKRFWYYIAFFCRVGPLTDFQSVEMPLSRAITNGDEVKQIADYLAEKLKLEVLDKQGTPIVGAPEPPKQVVVLSWTLLRTAKE